MALSQSALSDLLDAIRAGGSEDVVRDALHPPQRQPDPPAVDQGR